MLHSVSGKYGKGISKQSTHEHYSGRGARPKACSRRTPHCYLHNVTNIQTGSGARPKVSSERKASVLPAYRSVPFKTWLWGSTQGKQWAQSLTATCMRNETNIQTDRTEQGQQLASHHRAASPMKSYRGWDRDGEDEQPSRLVYVEGSVGLNPRQAAGHKPHCYLRKLRHTTNNCATNWQTSKGCFTCMDQVLSLGGG